MYDVDAWEKGGPYSSFNSTEEPRLEIVMVLEMNFILSDFLKLKTGLMISCFCPSSFGLDFIKTE